MQVSIVNFSNVISLFDFRIDGEYWHPEYLTSENEIERHAWKFLNQVAKVRGGKRLPLGDIFTDEGVYYIRAEDNKKTFCEFCQFPKD